MIAQKFQGRNRGFTRKLPPVDEFEGPNPSRHEIGVVGSIFLDPGILAEAASIPEPSDFFDESLGKMFGVMLEMHRNGESVDVITIPDRLEEKAILDEIGGVERIAEIAQQADTDRSSLIGCD